MNDRCKSFLRTKKKVPASHRDLAPKTNKPYLTKTYLNILSLTDQFPNLQMYSVQIYVDVKGMLGK